MGTLMVVAGISALEVWILTLIAGIMPISISPRLLSRNSVTSIALRCDHPTIFGRMATPTALGS